MNTNLNAKRILIKCGGSIINNVLELKILLDNIAILKSQGFQIIIVHGGGPDITRLCKDLHIESQFVNGQRVTSLEVLDITIMALCKVNCSLVQNLNQANARAIGLSGHDDNLLQADFIDKENMGYVGQVTDVNIKLINDLLALGLTPVIAPIGIDKAGNNYNINADLVAGEVASSLNVNQLILLSDIDGFYQDFNDKTSLVKELSVDQIRHMLSESTVNGGMIPKLTASMIAVSNGVRSSHIINGNNPDGLTKVAAGISTVGTTIVERR